MRKSLITFCLTLCLGLIPFSSAYAGDDTKPGKTVIQFEDGTQIQFDRVLTDDEIIAIYEAWYKGHLEYGTF